MAAKNCPVCTRQPHIELKSFGLGSRNIKARVICRFCGKKTAWYRTYDGWASIVFEAIDDWNRR